MNLVMKPKNKFLLKLGGNSFGMQAGQFRKNDIRETTLFGPRNSMRIGLRLNI